MEIGAVEISGDAWPLFESIPMPLPSIFLRIFCYYASTNMFKQ
ncbi:conserved hypothetical protein [delta proteobacterium NaphS2]|nr:conserved hypothetical protein [delta proteobacterium NaphS2]